MRQLAKWCFTHRVIVLLAWVTAAAGLTAIASGTGGAYRDEFKLPHTQSFDAINLLQRNAPQQSGDTEQIVIAVNHDRVTDPATRTRAQAVLANIAQQPHVSGISSPYAPGGAHQIAPSGRIAFASVTFDVQANKFSTSEAKALVSSVTSASRDGVQFQVEGPIAKRGTQASGSGGVSFGFLAAAIVLLLVFGSLLATALPLITAGLSLATGIAAIGLLSHVIDMATFSSQLALLIGLGVGVDYALFIVTRYRQGVLRGLSGKQATVESLDTSGRAVLYAGMIVCIAMLGMFALGVSFLYGVAIAATTAVAFTVLAALTLLPALLGFFGPRVLRRRDRRALRDGLPASPGESRLWTRWAGLVQRRPVVLAAVAAGTMLVIAAPALSMRFGSADAGSDPAGSTSRQAYDLLAKGFGPGYNGPLQLVAQISSPAQQVAFGRVERAVANSPGVVGSTPASFLPGVHGQPGVAIANVYPKGSPQDASTEHLLSTARGVIVPAAERGTSLHVLVGGNTAIFADFSHILTTKLPLFIGIVVLLSFLLLMAVFRSILIPLTASVMNLLSVGAAFGVVTAIFQNGWGASLLGIDKAGPIEAFLPVLMFPILFGLSMDYEVFLLTRIQEEWERPRDNRAAVTHGLAATARTITAAAAVMVLVFGAFILGGNRIIELLGVGLASAVLLDALIIRSILVPAVMIMLDKGNWWLPRPLRPALPSSTSKAAGHSPTLHASPSR